MGVRRPWEHPGTWTPTIAGRLTMVNEEPDQQNNAKVFKIPIAHANQNPRKTHEAFKQRAGGVLAVHVGGGVRGPVRDVEEPFKTCLEVGVGHRVPQTVL